MPEINPAYVVDSRGQLALPGLRSPTRQPASMPGVLQRSQSRPVMGNVQDNEPGSWPAPLLRSVSDRPLPPHSVLGGECASPKHNIHGLAYPALRANSELHKRHRADLHKYSAPTVGILASDRVPTFAEDQDYRLERAAGRGSDLAHAMVALDPGDLRRNMASRSAQGVCTGRQAMLLHMNYSGGARPPEQTYAMPHPFYGHAPRDFLKATSPRKRIEAAARRNDEATDTAVPDEPPTPDARTVAMWEQDAKGRITNLQARGHRRQSEHEDTEHEDTEDTGIASAMDLYNTVVDGLAGFIVVDLRSAEEYDTEHVWGAVDVAEAMTYRGKHALLISQTGDADTVHVRKGLSAMRAQSGILSVKMVSGGMHAWVSNYPFMCERTAVSAEEEQRHRRNRARITYPSQVLPWLFISGVEPAQDEKVLSDLEMTHVITLTADPEKVRVPKFCQRLKIALRDEREADIGACFDSAWQFICAARREGGRVLVHCKMGRSRSATVVLMAMFRTGLFSLRTAWEHLRACRRQISLNTGFVQTLIGMEKSVTGRASTVRWDEKSQRIWMD